MSLPFWTLMKQIKSWNQEEKVLAKKICSFEHLGFVCEFGGEGREKLEKRKRNEQVE